MKTIDKNGDRFITLEDIDGLSDSDLAAIRQLMPMGADQEADGPYEEGDGDGEEDEANSEAYARGADAEEGNESEGSNEEVGDGFPEPGPKDAKSEEFDEKYSHTEL